jgi:2-oxoglutarate ferredoxin oxidoreductase subunit alpha
LTELRGWGWELVRRSGDADPEVLVLTWGSTWGPSVEAVERLRAEGIAAAALAPRLLSPLPMDEIRQELEGPALRQVFIPEVNYLGQFAEVVKGRFFDTFRARPEVGLHKVNLYNGLPFTAGEIANAVLAARRDQLQPA